MIIQQRVAIGAAIVLGMVMVLQLLLAAGFPLGQAAWGGQNEVLPANLRWASLATVGILGLAAWIVLARSGLVAPGAAPVVIRLGTWAFVGFLSLNTLGNIVSSSPAERYVMAPVTLLLIVCFIAVALSPRSGKLVGPTIQE
jgi:cell shape-determining protein MreD